MTLPLTLTLPASYGWVGITAFVGILVPSVYQSFIVVSGARRRAKIAYPQLYAEKAEAAASRDAHLFNCAQRAHHNTLETLPLFVFTTLIAGLQAPRLAVGFGALWSVSRVLYTRGYTTGDPKRRAAGAKVGAVANLGLLGTAAYTLYKLVASNGFSL